MFYTIQDFLNTGESCGLNDLVVKRLPTSPLSVETDVPYYRLLSYSALGHLHTKETLVRARVPSHPGADGWERDLELAEGSR